MPLPISIISSAALPSSTLTLLDIIPLSRPSATSCSASVRTCFAVHPLSILSKRGMRSSLLFVTKPTFMLEPSATKPSSSNQMPVNAPFSSPSTFVSAFGR
uniref:Uncharacterized protein n=1 Tax=Arundo donax TaxID=35708 RepID=A0A0A9FG43_ARUDO